MIRIKQISILLILIFSNLFAINNEEFRSTWVITWEHDSDSSKIKVILDNHVAANMNAVLYQVRQGGTVYYPSSFEPWGYYAGYEDPGFDPLAFVIKEAHKRGLEVHAWFNTFQTSSTIAGSPAAKHPEWVCRDGDGNPMPQHRALSPGLKDVRDYTRDVAMEIVNNYDIDGLHLDYVRWNEYTTSSVLSKSSFPDNKLMDGQISEHQMELLKTTASANRYLYDVEHRYNDGTPEGFASWEDFWRFSTTELIKSLHDSIQVVKPYVRLSVAALGKYRWSGWQGYGSVYQDAADWYNQGYIDQLTPMHYHWTTGSGFYEMLTGGGDDNWGYWLNDDSNVLFSVGPGSYVLSDNNVWKNHASIVKECRKVDFVDGFQFFSYGTWENYQYWEEAGATFFPSKTKIRKNGNYSGDVPQKPQISLEKSSSTEYNLVIIPDVSETEKRWYVVYRSENETIDIDSSEIIAMKLTNEAFIITEEFDGTQNYNGQYSYSVTANNRYWWESELSNIQTSDAIPSNPPCLVNILPTEGDSIDINPEIIFEFSKEIDLASFENALTIVPDAEVSSIIISDDWNNKNKIITMSLVGLNHSTQYTITLNENLTDLNGVSLDGNNDGTPGDSYSIQFNTFNIDNIGPGIFATFPQVGVDEIDPENIFSIIFNELIDENTAAENIKIINNGNEINLDFMITKLNNKSIINCKTKSQLLSNSSIELHIENGITDTAGNGMNENVVISSNIADFYYSEIFTLDHFDNTNPWWDPEGAGGTVGTVGSKTTFIYSEDNYAPGFNNKESAKISYKWDSNHNGDFLLREHIPSGIPTTKQIDTSYTIQCYLYGDGSNNKFRFALYEKSGGEVAEVSKYHTINWVGWKLIEWDLSDPDEVGDWIGNGILDGGYYVIEGLHMTKGENGAMSGAVFVDELRIVKKSFDIQPDNHTPIIEEINDVTIDQGAYKSITVNYSDEDENDSHEIIALADTSLVRFNIRGHNSGDKIVIVPDDEFVGISEIMVVVKDFGVGELADTTIFTLNVGSTDVDDENVITRYSLSQNYPNPFNPETNIKFSIPKMNKVLINIYDMRGNKVHELVNDIYQAGIYNIKFNAGDYASGVYIYQLQAGEKVITKKMMLVK